ncbi:MAG: hypothetical protein KDC99_04210 [Cyclobacteriaceae bacterium]|nr:hypothetical protein [Cyclobacteriaceae bacterium]
MYIPFKDISENSRVWIYQLDREVNDEERNFIESVMKQFCGQWQVHGAPLQTSFEVFYNRFLVLAVDENSGGASGCSIDGSVRAIKEVGLKLDIDFFDRTKVAFRAGAKVSVYPMNELKELFSSATLNQDTITFDNLVTTKSELLARWEVPVSRSWLAKYLPKKALA